MSNKKDGNAFEYKCCTILFTHGFWVHLCQQNAAGQPADILAVKNGNAYLIDAKNCSRHRFELRRIESNQETAMSLWEKRNGNNALFFLGMGDDIYVVTHKQLQELKARGVKSITPADCLDFGKGLAEWLIQHS